MNGTILCGTAKTEITPLFPMYMGGYSCRREKSAGTHDPLYVRALALGNADIAVILLSFDLLAVDGLIAASLEEMRGLPVFGGVRPVFLPAATHTHYGPDGFPPNVRFGEWSAESSVVCEYRAALTGNIKKTVIKAWEERESCEIYRGFGKACFGLNRRNPAGPRDDRVTLLRFAPVSDTGKTKASVVRYTCHPTSMPRSGLLFSADYPGAVCDRIEKILGGGCLFFNGACGDISTRYSRREESYAETCRFGAELAQAAFDAVQGEEPLSPSVNLDFCRLPVGDKSFPAALLRIGEKSGLQALLIPGELFCSAANAWRERYGVEVWGYALGYAGYMPDAEAYEKGGYETEVSLMNKEQAALFMKAAEEFITGHNNSIS